MPHNATTRPYADLTDQQKLVSIFTFEPLAHIDPAILSPTVPEGRRFAYPPLLQFIVAMAGRLFGSQRKALIELRRPGVWEQCCQWYGTLIGEAVALPASPPTPREQDAFVARVASERNAVRRLSEELTELAIGQAVHQGQFPDDTTPDFANPDLRHMTSGDGTWQSAYTKVTEVVDPTTGKVVGHNGSRATSRPPRVQKIRLKGQMDGKEVDGINNLFIGTWTEAGRIILASRATVESEGKVAMEMIENLAHRLGPRLHTVVYDGALEGWRLQDLMARRGVLVMTKPKGRSSRAQQADGYSAPAVHEAEAATLHKSRRPFPLGTSAWLEREGLKIKRTTYRQLDEVAKAVATCPRRHELWIDGGVLVDVAYDTKRGRLVKTATATARSAEPQPNPDLLTWQLPIEWALPCDAAPRGTHHFSTVWQPLAGQHDRPTAGNHRALYDLRPLGISDRRFWDFFGKRNNAESHNHWYKDTFHHHGRAMRLDTDAQHLDQLAAATVVNAVTWWTYNRQHSLRTQHASDSGSALYG